MPKGAAKAAPTRPVAPPKDKRAAILTAALRVFAERGVNGVAVPEIAVAAGVATGTIYRYFPSKEALVNEVYRQEKRTLNAHLFPEPGSEELDAKASFDLFWQRMVSFVRTHPDAYRFLELQDHRPYLDEESRALERSALSPLKQRVKAQQRKGIYRKDARDAVMMTMMWGAFVYLFRAERDALLTLRPKDLAAAREICWQIFAGAASE